MSFTAARVKVETSMLSSQKTNLSMAGTSLIFLIGSLQRRKHIRQRVQVHIHQAMDFYRSVFWPVFLG